ncbi:MAG: inositol monophosphatase family protein [Pseudomonadota bacterium]
MTHSSYNTDFKSLHDFALDLSFQAGKLIRDERDNNRVTQNYKSLDELITSADLKSDKLIIDAIQKRYPTHRILSEETFNDLTITENLDSPLWIIDPIDGTVNYAHRHHQVAISIAYLEGKEAKVGVVHSPFQNETFTAIRGEGSFLNHAPIEVSHLTELKKALIGTGFPYDKSNLRPLVERVMSILVHCADIRRIGAASLDICWVACGRLDGYYESIKPWDFAAARLIAEEAGARCGHFTPVPFGIEPCIYGEDILISTPDIYDALTNILV